MQMLNPNQSQKEIWAWTASLHVCMLSCLSHVQHFGTQWTVAHQAPLSMGFSRQEYWTGLSFPSPGDLPNPGIKPWSPALVGRFFMEGATKKAPHNHYVTLRMKHPASNHGSSPPRYTCQMHKLSGAGG